MHLDNSEMTCAPFPNSYGLTRKASCIVSAAPANGDSINTPGLSLLTYKTKETPANIAGRYGQSTQHSSKFMEYFVR